MDRGAWWATVHGAARVGHHLTTEQQQEVCPAQVHFTFKETSKVISPGGFKLSVS